MSSHPFQRVWREGAEPPRCAGRLPRRGQPPTFAHAAHPLRESPPIAMRALLGSAAWVGIVSARGRLTHDNQRHHDSQPGRWDHDEEHRTGEIRRLYSPVERLRQACSYDVTFVPPSKRVGARIERRRPASDRELAPLSEVQSQARPVAACRNRCMRDHSAGWRGLSGPASRVSMLGHDHATLAG